MKLALGIGAVALIYYAWTQGAFAGSAAGPPQVIGAGGAGVDMTPGGALATVYGAGQQLGHTVNAAVLSLRRAPSPITAPTPVNPFLGAAKAAAAAAAFRPVAVAPGGPPNPWLVPVVRGTAAATPIT
jgi:hypothetical protein